MHHENRNKCDYFRFDSWSDLITTAAEGVPVISEMTRHSRYKDSDTERFTGTSSFPEAIKLATEGWPEGERKCFNLSDGIIDRVTSLVEKQHIVYDVEGVEIDIACYLRGEPECWMGWERTIGEGSGSNIIKIVYNCSASGGVSPEVIFAKGATVAALVQSLEFAGKRCEIWVGDASSRELKRGGVKKNETVQYNSLCKVKAADQDLDMGRIAFAMAHPSMLRRVMFSIMEMSNEMLKGNHIGGEYSCYGYPSEIPEEERGDIYIGESMLGEPYWLDTKAATKWVIDELRKQGIHLTEEADKFSI